MSEQAAMSAWIKENSSEDFSDTWYVSPDQLVQYGFKKNSQVRIVFGTGQCSAKIKLVTNESAEGTCIEDKDTLCLSGGIIRQLYLPTTYKLGLKVTGDRILLGPLIGVFVAPGEIEDFYNGETSNFNHRVYWLAARENSGLCCFFSIKDIVWEQKLVKAWVYSDNEAQDGGWISVILPLPAVIYDQCYGKEARKQGRLLRARAAGLPDVTVFNAMPKLRKWETYKVLQEKPGLLGYLPETMEYTSAGLKMMLKKHGLVYMKPDALSKGKGVFRVTKEGRSMAAEYRDKQVNRVYNKISVAELNLLLEPFQEKGGGYVIQQPIKLATHRGYPFDLRVLCQKDTSGNWMTGGIVVRMAALGSVITSPRSGGSVAQWPAVCESQFRQTGGEVSAVIREVAGKVCEAIEEYYGCCGELGLDIAVEPDGRVWLLEVNGKPLKVSLKKLLDVELHKAIYANPIRYASYLGFSFNGDEKEK